MMGDRTFMRGLTTKICIISVLLGFLVAAATQSQTSVFQSPSKLVFESGLSQTGSFASNWLSIVENRHSQKDFDNLKRSRSRLSPEESRWLKLMTDNLKTLDSDFQRIAMHSPRGHVPDQVTIVTANRGGNDGFSFGTRRIGLDLSHWTQAYGQATKSGNEERMRRILMHEYTHLITTSYRTSLKNKYGSNPWQRAIWTLYHEGLGTYWSLSSRWINKDRTLTSLAERKLRELVPVLKERLTALYQDNGALEHSLRKSISGGAFDERWGSLVVALWLSQETNRSDAKFGEWIKKGPQGIQNLISNRTGMSWGF